MYTPGPWYIGAHQQIQSKGWSIRIKGDDSAITYVLGEKNPGPPSKQRSIRIRHDQDEWLRKRGKVNGQIVNAIDLYIENEDESGEDV